MFYGRSWRSHRVSGSFRNISGFWRTQKISEGSQTYFVVLGISGISGTLKQFSNAFQEASGVSGGINRRSRVLPGLS